MAVTVSDRGWLFGGRYLLVLVAAGTVLFWMQPVVSAAPPGSAVISSVPLPGFVPVPAFTGPVSAANESAIFRYAVEGGLEQFLVNGQAHAYMRAWTKPGPGSAYVQIVTMSFNDGSYPARVIAGFKVVDKRRFNVPGISGAFGFLLPAAGSGGSTPESDVIFSKESTLYLVVFGAQSGTTSAIKVAKAQFNGLVSQPVHHHS